MFQQSAVSFVDRLPTETSLQVVRYLADTHVLAKLQPRQLNLSPPCKIVPLSGRMRTMLDFR
jgi:hypothetical protein